MPKMCDLHRYLPKGILWILDRTVGQYLILNWIWHLNILSFCTLHVKSLSKQNKPKGMCLNPIIPGTITNLNKYMWWSRLDHVINQPNTASSLHATLHCCIHFLSEGSPVSMNFVETNQHIWLLVRIMFRSINLTFSYFLFVIYVLV